MMENKKKRTKALRMKNLKAAEDIIRVDEQTFYHPSKDPKMEGEPYMVFKSNREGWLCDCMSFVMSMTDDGHSPECKHITKIKKQYGIQ